MTDPYDTLGLPNTATDDEIRQKYLALVREFPPDRSPERFAVIRAAYDELRDPVHRLKTRLFSFRSQDSIDAVVADVRVTRSRARLPTALLLSLGEK